MGVFDDLVNKGKSLAEDLETGANELLGKMGFDDAIAQLKGYKTSSWQGLNPYLVAKIYPVKVVIQENGERTYIQDESQGKPVLAPVLEGAEMEYSLNWQSPFEQTGLDNQASALTSMLQSGSLTQMVDSGQRGLGADGSSLTDSLQGAEGRTGITKLNSIQTFSGMPPVKCSLKILFRAFKDAKKEVNDPLKQLLMWALPQKLSRDGQW